MSVQETLGYLLWLVQLLTSSCAHLVTSVMWLWVGVPLLCMSSGCGGICPSPLMSYMYCTSDVIYIYTVLFGIACLAYHSAIKCALCQPLYPEFIVNCFDIKRTAATFAQFSCTLNCKHKGNFCLIKKYGSRIHVSCSELCSMVSK